MSLVKDLALGHVAQSEAELVWMFQDAASSMGLRSNFTSMVNQIACPRDHSGAPTEVSERLLDAASRARVITRALGHIGLEHVQVLRLAFGEFPPAWLAKAFGERLAGVVTGLPAVAAMHRRSKSSKPLLEWLERIGDRKASSTAQTQAFEVRLAAERALTVALDRYRRARSELHRRARAQERAHQAELEQQRLNDRAPDAPGAPSCTPND